MLPQTISTRYGRARTARAAAARISARTESNKTKQNADSQPEILRGNIIICKFTEKMEQLYQLLERVRNLTCMTQPQQLPFSILQYMYQHISAKEVLHSKIIAELLRPNGEHQCGDIFLLNFMQKIGLTVKDEELSDIKVYTEYSTKENRRIDILLLCDDKAVIIENKLNDAQDQPEQLKAYFEDTLERGKQVAKIVYIPLYEWRKSHETLPTNVTYLYPYDLICWLVSSSENSGRAKEIAEIYIQLLKYMNQVNINHMNAKELYDAISADTDMLHTVMKISAICNSAEWYRLFKSKIESAIKDKYEDSGDLQFKYKTNNGELWVWHNEYLYWISVDINPETGEYYIYKYFDNKPEVLPKGVVEPKSNNYSGGYYYQSPNVYKIGDKADFEKMLSEIIEFLKSSRK